MKRRLLLLYAPVLSVLLVCALLLPALPVAAASSAVSDVSDASDASDVSDVSGVDEEEEEEYNILAPGREGLYNPDYTPMASAWCVLNTDTGLRVAQKNADTPYVAASLVKMMTAILTVEHMENFNKDYDETLVDTTDKLWVYEALYGMNASTADIRMGEILSVRQLLYAILLPSANEAAWFLADYVSGGNMTNFMHQMNTRAAALGCTGTYFDDPNGLSEMNRVTAYDAALIMREFAKHPLLLEICQSDVYELPENTHHNNPYNIHNTNRIMVQSSPYYAYRPTVGQAMLAGKTGSLGEWQNFATIASKDGETYVCVVLHSPYEADPIAEELETNPRPALVEAAELLSWAFRELTVRPALDVSQPVTELRVRYSTQQSSVMLMPEDDIKAVLPKDAAGEEMLKRQYDLPESVDAPLEAGTVLGSITLSIGDQEIGTSVLRAERSIERNDTLFVMNKTEDVLTSTAVKVIIVVVVIAAVLYAGLFWLANNSRKRKKAQQKAAGRTQSQGRKPKGW